LRLCRDGAVDKVGAAPWVEVGKAGEIVYLCIYDDPLQREGGVGWGSVRESRIRLAAAAICFGEW